MRFALLAALTLLVSNLAFAAPYGMAGCGVGALAIGDKPGKIQILAATLNQIISPQTSAITSGTSNCYEDDGQGNVASELYIQNNQVALQEDIAKGDGEALAGLLELWHCDNNAPIQNSLKSNYNQIFSNKSDAKAVKTAIESTIRSSDQTKNSCSALI